MQIRDNFVLRLICNGKMTGKGIEAKRKSVNIFIADALINLLEQTKREGTHSH